MNSEQLENFIFDTTFSFTERALAVFNYQYNHIEIYNDFCNLLGKTPNNVQTLTEIPFLPIELFKWHKILSKERGYETIFRSSGTTGQTPSQHFIADLNLYERAILKGFEDNYGSVKDYCILGLLPSYLERKDASLVHMVDYLMSQSQHPKNGFYLNNLSTLANTLTTLIKHNQPTILIGVTFALLDFAEQFPMDLHHTIIMETGGMKGRREEMTRHELHNTLKNAFQVDLIHSEYGMTELLSQSYFKSSGRFQPSSTIKMLARDITDPFCYVENGRSGALNIVDLANIYSCSFIATQDIGKVYQNNEFDVLGRTSASDLRGCNLMIL